MRRSTRVSVAALAVTAFALTACGAERHPSGRRHRRGGRHRGRQRHGHRLGDGHGGRGPRRVRQGVHRGEPGRHDRRHGHPLGRGPRQDRDGHRGRRGARRLDDRHHLDGRVRHQRRAGPDPARPHRRVDVLPRRLGLHRGGRHVLRGALVRRDPRAVRRHRAGGAGRRLADPRDVGGPDGDVQGHAVGRRPVGHHAAGRSDGRVADVPAVRVAGGRGDHERGADRVHVRQPRVRQGAHLLPVVLHRRRRPQGASRGHARTRLRRRQDRRVPVRARGTSGSSTTPAARASSTA